MKPKKVWLILENQIRSAIVDSNIPSKKGGTVRLLIQEGPSRIGVTYFKSASELYPSKKSAEKAVVSERMLARRRKIRQARMYLLNARSSLRDSAKRVKSCERALASLIRKG